ncbi:MAG TPA: tRNA threonylcarbamoyladenosine dehydratase [Dysgonamonadaceae bacterium]|nr:tRNA threonylcarbamoyladenosine dehydratase [Dysgonamonadaceae bacterium]
MQDQNQKINQYDNLDYESPDNCFSRVDLLLGKEALDLIASQRVILFGVGGVGSWCAEALIRSGIKHLTMVDPDRINLSNMNRQLPATSKTIGELKVEVLKERLLEINPEAEIEAIAQIYTEGTSNSFYLHNYHYIVDAIDTLTHKAHLLIESCKTDAEVFSSMGAGLKMDPLRIHIAEFWKVKGCKLAAAMRQRFRKGEKPSRKIQCVYSEELLQNKGEDNQFDEKEEGDIISRYKPHTNGTMLHITGTFGFTLASMVLNDINNKLVNMAKIEKHNT